MFFSVSHIILTISSHTGKSIGYAVFFMRPTLPISLKSPSASKLEVYLLQRSVYLGDIASVAIRQ